MAGVQDADRAVVDSISRVQQLSAEHCQHTSSMAGQLEAQTKVCGGEGGMNERGWLTALIHTTTNSIRILQVDDYSCKRLCLQTTC